MSAEELKDTLRQQPFEPFRLVMTDSAGYDIRHPDLLWIGKRTAMVGFSSPGQTLCERPAKIDLLHIVSMEPSSANGMG